MNYHSTPNIPVQMLLALDLLLASELSAPLMVCSFVVYGSWKTPVKQGSVPPAVLVSHLRVKALATDLNFSCF